MRDSTCYLHLYSQTIGDRMRSGRADEVSRAGYTAKFSKHMLALESVRVDISEDKISQDRLLPTFTAALRRM